MFDRPMNRNKTSRRDRTGQNGTADSRFLLGALSQVRQNKRDGDEGQQEPAQNALSFPERLRLKKIADAMKESLRSGGRFGTKRHSAPSRIAHDRNSSDDENDAPPAGRRRSAPAALEQRALPRDRTETQLLTYDHGDALAKEYDRKSSAAVGSSWSSAVAGGSSGASSSLGAGIWDEDMLAEQICALTSEVCPHECCRARAGVEFARSEPRGLGGSLVFQCRSCGGPRELQRSRRVGPRGGAKGARAEESTLRFVSSCVDAGMGLRAANAVLIGQNLPPLNERTWAGAAAKTAEAETAVFEKMVEKNIKKEIALALLHEGDAALAPGGSVYITVMTDGSWSKRYGRNSLFGIGAMYGRYTNACVFAGSRCSRCAVCMRAAHTGKEAPEEHACTKNWDERVGKDGAASKMEKDIALEGAKFLLERGAISRVRQWSVASTSDSCLRRVVEPGGSLCDRSALSLAQGELSLSPSLSVAHFLAPDLTPPR